jgi:hypothetical protein
VLGTHFTGLPSVTLELELLALLRWKRGKTREARSAPAGRNAAGMTQGLLGAVRVRKGNTAAQTSVGRAIFFGLSPEAGVILVQEVALTGQRSVELSTARWRGSRASMVQAVKQQVEQMQRMFSGSELGYRYRV